MQDSPLFGQIQLGYAPVVDHRRDIAGVQLTLMPTRPDVQPDAAELLRVLTTAFPPPEGSKADAPLSVLLNIASEPMLDQVLRLQRLEVVGPGRVGGHEGWNLHAKACRRLQGQHLVQQGLAGDVQQQRQRRVGFGAFGRGKRRGQQAQQFGRIRVHVCAGRHQGELDASDIAAMVHHRRVAQVDLTKQWRVLHAGRAVYRPAVGGSTLP